MPAIANSQRAPMRCRDAGLGLQVAARVETAACRRSAAPRFDGRSRLPGSARRRVPESVGRRPLSLAAVERPSRTLVPRPSRVRRQTSRTMTTMMTTTAMAAMPMLRVVMGPPKGWSTGPAESAPGQPDPSGCRYSLPGVSVGSGQFAYRGLVGAYLLEIDREARPLTRSDRARSPRTRHSPCGRPDTIASISSRGAVAAGSSTRRPGGPRKRSPRGAAARWRAGRRRERRESFVVLALDGQRAQRARLLLTVTSGGRRSEPP